MKRIAGARSAEPPRQRRPAGAPERARERRVMVAEGLLSDALARSVAEFVEKQLDPTIRIRIDAADPKLLLTSDEQLHLKAEVPGAHAVFALRSPEQMHVRGFAPFSSRAWAYETAYWLFQFSEAVKANQIGRHLANVSRCGAIHTGGPLVREAILNPPEPSYRSY